MKNKLCEFVVAAEIIATVQDGCVTEHLPQRQGAQASEYFTDKDVTFIVCVPSCMVGHEHKHTLQCLYTVRTPPSVL